jgi:hypothetical protein
MNNPTESATPRQRFALYCATKLNTKELDITKEQASELIGLSKSGNQAAVIAALQSMGATGEAKATPSVDYAAIYSEAHAAGQAAAEAHMPTPMIVQEHANPLDDSSPIIREYAPVLAGVCGFAWVNVSPGTQGFAKYLKANHGARRGYYGGIELWVRDYGQSMEKKEAYASAFAHTLNAHGIKAHAGSRMD